MNSLEARQALKQIEAKALAAAEAAQATGATNAGRARWMPRSPALFAGLLVMPLVIAAGLLRDDGGASAPEGLDLRPSISMPDVPSQPR